MQEEERRSTRACITSMTVLFVFLMSAHWKLKTKIKRALGRIDQLHGALEVICNSYCSLEKSYDNLLGSLESQNKLLDKGTVMELAVLLGYMANTEEVKGP